jgi:hypothetical protein
MEPKHNYNQTERILTLEITQQHDDDSPKYEIDLRLNHIWKYNESYEEIIEMNILAILYHYKYDLGIWKIE